MAAIPAVGLLAGSAVGLLAGEHLGRAPCWLLIVAGAASLAAWAASRPWLMAATVASAFAAGGIVLAADGWQKAWRPTLRIAFEGLARGERRAAAAAGRVLPEDDEAFAVIEGTLRSDASIGAAGVSLSIDVDRITGPALDEDPWQSRESPVRGGLLATVTGSLGPPHVDEWRAGRRVRLPVQLHRPSRYLDPGVPDSERGLARAGTTLVGTVKSGALVDLIGIGGWWSEAVGRVRTFARHAIADAVGSWNPQSAAIVCAIVLGDRTGLDGPVQRRLQEAGTYHVIAISGGNIAILAGLLLGAFRLAGCLGRTAMLAAIAVLLAYAGLVGGGASVERATLMAVVYFAGRACDQRSPPTNSLWVVAAVLVLRDPLAAADPGFVLTFGATLGILLTQRSTVARERSRGTSIASSAMCSAARAAFGSMFVASLAAEAILFPVGAVLFSRVTFAGLGLNFLAIPLMAVAQLAGMAVVPAALVSVGAAAAFGWVAHIGAAGLIWSADLVRFAPALASRVAPPSWAAVAVYYASLGTAWGLRARSSSSQPRFIRQCRTWSPAVGVFAGLWILFDPSGLLAARGDGRLHITFIDVGQGDSALLRFPGGKTMVVDGGGAVGSSSFDVGERVVAPVLRDAGVRTLDYLVVTHGDPDHAGGIPALIREFRPREVWEGVPVPRSRSLTELRLEAQSAGTVWANVYHGNRLLVDGVEISVRHPALPDWERQKVRNDDSIVLDVRWRDVSVLLTGDIGVAVERGLLDDVPPAPLQLIKVPHHGSLTSSGADFVHRLQPRIAIFSAGRANHFGHPAPAVLARYRDAGAEIFRTDQDGAVEMNTDGHSIEVSTINGRHVVLTSAATNHEDPKDTKQ